MSFPATERGNSRDLLTGAAYGAVAGLMMASTTFSALGFVLFLWLSPVPLFLAGFDRGLKAGWSAAVAALPAMLLMGVPVEAVGELAVLIVLPAALLTSLALLPGGRREERLVLALLAIGVVLLYVQWMRLPPESEFIGALQRLMGPSPEAPLPLKELAQFYLRWFGIVVVVLLAWYSFCGTLAAGLARKGRAPALDRLWMGNAGVPRWFGGITAVLMLATWLSGSSSDEAVAVASRNLLVLALFGHGLAGLGVVHTLFRVNRISLPVRIIVYLLGFIFSGIVGMALVTLGLIEQWAGLRRRMTAAAHKADEER